MPDLASPLTPPPATLPPPNGAETADPRQDPKTREPGPLRNGNPRGNPNLAPRCGAKNRAGGACQAPALRGHTRCRLHGGASTGPRTAEGFARLAAAQTSHGRETEAMRAEWRHRRVTLWRLRVFRAAVGLKAWLPEAQRERLRWGSFGAPELRMPAHPGVAALAREAAAGPEGARRDAQGRFVKRAKGTRRGVAGERAAARAERAALAPWKAAIAVARVARRAAWAAKRKTSRQDPMNREDGGVSVPTARSFGGAIGPRDKPGDDGAMAPGGGDAAAHRAGDARRGRGTRDSRQDPLNREPGRLARRELDEPHAPVLPPPPGLTRKERKRWKWVQRQARKARGEDVVGAGHPPQPPTRGWAAQGRP